jgi:MATE family, multidrug and toxin extrusion protein
MASMHYGTPSSLPSDYALLSRYASARGTTNSDEPVDDLHDLTEPNDVLDDILDDILPNRPAVRRSSFSSPHLRPLQPKLPEPYASRVSVPDEYTPLLVPRIEEEVGPSTDPVHSQGTAKVYRDEFRILIKYTLPVFGYASSFIHCFWPDASVFSTHVLEYSLSIASVISIGHLSTVALAACTLGTMTASVTGYSIIQGLTSTLDTMLPSAWTSPQPQLVGLWTQRMGQ